MSELDRISDLADEYREMTMHRTWADFSAALHAECADRAAQISRLLHEEADYWTRWGRLHESPGSRL